MYIYLVLLFLLKKVFHHTENENRKHIHKKLIKLHTFAYVNVVCQLDSTMLDVPADFQSNDIEYSPRITVDTKWTDALRSR